MCNYYYQTILDNKYEDKASKEIKQEDKKSLLEQNLPNWALTNSNSPEVQNNKKKIINPAILSKISKWGEYNSKECINNNNDSSDDEVI